MRNMMKKAAQNVKAVAVRAGMLMKDTKGENYVDTAVKILIAVVLGAPSGAERFDAAKEMLNYGFANYRLYPIAQRGAKVRGELPIIGGESDRLSLELGGYLTLIIQKGDEQNVLLTPSLPDAVEAPVEQGAEIGSVRVEIGGKTIATLPILAAESVHGKGLQTAIRRMIRNWAVCE